MALKLKLARDGNQCTQIPGSKNEIAASRREHLLGFHAKMHEEVGEIIADPQNPEEYADLFETVEAYAKMQGVSLPMILDAKRKKKARRGGFEKGVIWSHERPVGHDVRKVKLRVRLGCAVGDYAKGSTHDVYEIKEVSDDPMADRHYILEDGTRVLESYARPVE